MARGTSGRIVIEIDPETKNELYQQLKKDDSNLKAWFLEHVDNFLKGRHQLTLELHPTKLSTRHDEGKNEAKS